MLDALASAPDCLPVSLTGGGSLNGQGIGRFFPGRAATWGLLGLIGVGVAGL